MGPKKQIPQTNVTENKIDSMRLSAKTYVIIAYKLWIRLRFTKLKTCKPDMQKRPPFLPQAETKYSQANQPQR